MDIIQDSFGLINHEEPVTHFVIHAHDRSQPIETHGKTGGNSPCSYDFIFTNPTTGYLVLEKLKANKKRNDGHVFTPLQLSPIVKGAMLLEDVLALIDEVAERETGYILKETLKTHQNNAFKVLVQPKLTPNEEKERQDLIQNPTNVGCVSFNDRYLFRSDTPADAPFIILKDKDIVIRGKIDLDKDEKGKTFLELLKTKTGLFWNFKSILEQIDNFYQSGLPIRQEFMDISMVRSQVRARFYCFYTRTVPVIINLIENTRRLLFDTIIKEHGKELAPSLQKARFLLKTIIKTFINWPKNINILRMPIILFNWKIAEMWWLIPIHFPVGNFSPVPIKYCINFGILSAIILPPNNWRFIFNIIPFL